MKSFTVPEDCPVGLAVNDTGKISWAEFVSRFVLPRPAFRVAENVEFAEELIDGALLPAGSQVTLTHDAFGLLERECSFPGVDVNWQLVRVVNRFQRALSRATTVRELKGAAE